MRKSSGPAAKMATEASSSGFSKLTTMALYKQVISLESRNDLRANQKAAQYLTLGCELLSRIEGSDSLSQDEVVTILLLMLKNNPTSLISNQNPDELARLQKALVQRISSYDECVETRLMCAVLKIQLSSEYTPEEKNRLISQISDEAFSLIIDTSQASISTNHEQVLMLARAFLYTFSEAQIQRLNYEGCRRGNNHDHENPICFRIVLLKECAPRAKQQELEPIVNYLLSISTGTDLSTKFAAMSALSHCFTYLENNVLRNRIIQLLTDSLSSKFDGEFAAALLRPMVPFCYPQQIETIAINAAKLKFKDRPYDHHGLLSACAPHVSDTDALQTIVLQLLDKIDPKASYYGIAGFLAYIPHAKNQHEQIVFNMERKCLDISRHDSPNVFQVLFAVYQHSDNHDLKQKIIMCLLSTDKQVHLYLGEYWLEIYQLASDKHKEEIFQHFMSERAAGNLFICFKALTTPHRNHFFSKLIDLPFTMVRLTQEVFPHATQHEKEMILGYILKRLETKSFRPDLDECHALINSLKWIDASHHEGYIQRVINVLPNIKNLESRYQLKAMMLSYATPQQQKLLALGLPGALAVPSHYSKDYFDYVKAVALKLDAHSPSFINLIDAMLKIVDASDVPNVYKKKSSRVFLLEIFDACIDAVNEAQRRKIIPIIITHLFSENEELKEAAFTAVGNAFKYLDAMQQEQVLTILAADPSTHASAKLIDELMGVKNSDVRLTIFELLRTGVRQENRIMSLLSDADDEEALKFLSQLKNLGVNTFFFNIISEATHPDLGAIARNNTRKRVHATI